MNYIQGNSNISHTYHIFLDSDSGIKSGNSMQFDISPTIEVSYPTRGFMYLKEFSGLNTLYNINDSNNRNNVTLSGSSVAPDVELDKGNVLTGSLLADKLNIAFPAVTFTFDSSTLKMTATTSGNVPMTFTGNLFEKMLNFKTNELVASPYRSYREVDIHRSTHSIYMSIGEVANNTRDVGTASNKGSRIAKIPVLTDFGKYIVYQCSDPVQKSPIENSIINQLNIQLFDDDGHNYTPDRFTCTLALEIAAPVQTDFKHELNDKMPASYSTHKSHPILQPSLKRSCNF